MSKERVSIYKAAKLREKKKAQERASAYLATKQNRGSDVGYVAKRAGTDFLRVGEGVVDAALVPIDLLTGNVEQAKSRFLDSPVDDMRERLDREYNPGKVAGFIGDIAGGIGQSVGYGLISAIPYAGTPMMYSSIVEQSISSAAEKTGEVGWKEVGYGATAGAVEGLLESKLGAGVKAAKGIGSAILKKTGINVAESAAKAGGKTMLKSVLTETAKGFAGEFAEEAISEAVDPALLRLYNINENAQFSLKDVAYAGLIGGLSGGIMSAGPAAINYRSSVRVGRALQESGLDGDLVKRAKYTLSALEADQTRSTSQIKGKPEGDTKETAKEWLSRKAENRKVKRLSRETKELSDKIRKNIDAYEKYRADPKMSNSEPVAALLGELRGNLFLVGYAYEADVIEQVMMDATDEKRQAFVDAVNEVLAAQGKKHDYTLADFDANKDDIRRGLAGLLMADEMQGYTAKYGAEATESPVEPAQATKDTTAEEVAAQEENAATEATEAAEPDPWESIEGIEGFGTQNAQEEALLRAASSQGVPKRTVPAMLKRYREGTDLTPAEFAEAWGDGVMFFGRLGLNESAIYKNSPLDRIGENARRASIQEGKIIADEELKRAKEKAEKKKMPARNQADAKRKQEGRGAIVKGKGLIVQDLDAAQYAAYKAAETFAAVLGTDIVIETDLKTDTGKQINGFYSQKTNGIHININAKRNGQSIALYTLGHEVTHYIKAWSPEKFKTLSDFVLNQMGEKAQDMIAAKAEFLRKIPDYKDYTVTQLNDLAVEEVVADSMELVLSDGKILDELARTEKTVWQKIKDFITKIITDIRKYYGELNQASKTAKVLKETVDSLEEIEQLFYEGVTEAGERTRTAGVGKAVQRAGEVVYSSNGQYNFTDSQQFKNWFGDWEKHPNTASKLVNTDGTPKILYHQTAEDFTVFDPKHTGAGTTDFETPFGIFMKPTDSDIGLKGQKQMALYANIRKTLEANDRADLVEKLKSLSPKYADLLNEMQSMNEEYKSKVDDAFNAWPPFVEEYRKTHPQVSRREILLDAEAKKVYDEPKRLTEEWTKKSDALAVKCKEEINKTLKDNGYDGVHIREDAGSGGRNTETYIALDPEQVKSATDNIGTFDGTNPDIRYSIDETPETPDVSNYNATLMSPWDVEPINRITSKKMFDYLVSEFEENGYNGRPIVVLDGQAITGSHRILAAREAGIDIPVVEISVEEVDPLYEELLNAGDDRQRAKVAKELYDDGTINKEAYDLINREDELNEENWGREPEDAIRYSIDEDTDTAYLAAVERGDMVTAQKMVDKAAKAEGYKIKAYHGTNAEFTVFDKNRVGKGIDQYGAGFYFASNADVTERYGNRKYDVYLSLKKPIRLVSKARGEGKSLYDVKITQTQAYKILKKHPMMYDQEESPLGDFYDDYWEVGPEEWMIKDLAKQYTNIGDLDADVILYRNYPNELHEAIREVIGYDGVEVYFESDAMVDERNDYFYVAWFDNQMKSADPVTYDDNGNVIPLSERFKEDNSDIRYSIDDTPETPDVSDSAFDEALRRAGLSHLVEDTAEAETTETAPPPRKAPRESDPDEDRLDRIRAHETLANALMEAAQNEHEFRLVKNYRQKAAELADAEVRKEDLRKKTAEVNREIDTLQSKLKGVDKTKREPWVMTALTDAQKRKGEMLDEMDALDEKLRAETDKLLSLASAKQLRKLIRAERSKAAAMERSAERARQREMDSKEWAKETVKKAREESEEKVKKARQEAQDYKAAVYKTSMEKVYKAKREATDYKRAVYRTAYAKADEKNQKYRDRLDEMDKQSMERREITSRMRAARRVLGYLNTMIYHPTKLKHVPESLQALVDKTLRSADPKQFGINRDHIREMSELAGKIRKLESKAGRTTAEQETLDKMKTKYEKLEADTISVKRQAEALMTAFEQYVTSTTDGVMVDKDMLEGLRQTVTEIEEAPLNEMTLKSLQAVEKIYTVIYHQVNTANQAFATEKAASIDQMSTKANTQVKNAKELKFLSPRSREWAALAGVRSFLWKNMKPLTVFEAIGSDKLMEIFRRVLDGEDVWITDILEAKKALDEAKKEFGYNSWNLKERREVTTADGSKVSLTIGEMMSLYAYMFREQAEQHLSVGGFVFAPVAKAIEKFKGSKALYQANLNDQTTHRMRPEDIAKMSALLTEEQRAYARAVQEYLTSLGAKGNEVSRKLYGIDLFNETAYFPIKSSQDYIETQTGKSGDPNIKSRGTFKETVPKAGNPIVLQDFMEVVGDHVNTMAIYHAFVLPVEDLTRVWNYTPVNIKRDADGKAILDENGMPVADDGGEGGYNSLKAEIAKKYGKEANDYILQLIRDLNGGARRESAASILDKGLTAFKRSATMLSLSVIVQQPTSILRAMAYVDAKHFTGASFVPWETVKKYAPVAAIKEMGGFDTGTGARTADYINSKKYENRKDKLKAAALGILPESYGGDKQARDEYFGFLTSKADEVAWRYMFGAIVNEQAEKLGKTKDSEEVLKAAGERFAEVVRRTQVYDSTLTRSEYMRSKDGLMKMATAFGAEPTTVVSMVADAIIKAERGDKTFLRKSAAGIAFSVIANAAVASIIYAMRDDDEDETIPEKYVQSLTSELIEGFNPLEYLPIARDIMSMFKGYEIERSDMALVGNLMEQVEMITSSKRSVPDKIFGVTGAVSAFFGLPVTNVYRDFKGIVKTGMSFTDTEEQTGAGLGHAMGDAVRGQFNLLSKLFGAESGNAYELYTAYVRGDTAHYERVKARYKTTQAAEMALRTELRDNDKRISEAAEARLSGDLAVYESLVDQIESEGIFDRNIVIRAINNEMLDLKDEDTSKLVPKDETVTDEEEETAESLYKASDLNNALERGDVEDFAAILDALVQDKVSTGKTEAQARASVKSSVTAYWKRLYIDAWSRGDTEERKRIIAILTETGLYGSRNDVATIAQNWVKNSQ